MNLSKTAKIMILSSVAVYFALLAAGLIILNLAAYFNIFGDAFEIEKNLPYILGLTLGLIHSVVKIVMIEKAVIKIADTEEKKQAKNMGQLYYFGRFIITIAVLVLGALPAVPFIGFFGTVVGVFSLRIAVYITTAIEVRMEKEVKIEKNQQEIN